MKVVNTRKVNDRIIQYMSREQLNSLLGMSLSAPVSMDEIIFEEPAKLESYAASFRASMKQDNVDYTEEQSLIASMIMSVLDETTGDIQQIPAVILDEIIRNGHIFRRGELESNPYFANIHFENQKQGRFELGTASLKKYELFMYNVPVNRFQGVMIPSIGACDHRFRFPYMKEGHKAWIIYTEAPDLKHDVISYHHDGKDKFALISEGDGFETIYITDSIPLDCDWDALVADCEAQLNGKEPMEMRTKARLIVDTAYQNAGDKYTRDIKDLFMPAPEPTSTDIQLAIAQLGYSIDDLKKMDHHDIDAAFFNSICATK